MYTFLEFKKKDLHNAKPCKPFTITHYEMDAQLKTISMHHPLMVVK